MNTHASPLPDDRRTCPTCGDLRAVLYAWRDGVMHVQCRTCFAVWKEARKK